MYRLIRTLLNKAVKIIKVVKSVVELQTFLLI